jgi:hypothetical protein
MEEGRRHLAILDVLRITLNPATTQACDFIQGTDKGCLSDPLTAMISVDEKASDSPVRRFNARRAVGAQVLDPWEFIGRTELAPADAVLALKHQARVGRSFTYAALLPRATVRASYLSLRMKCQAPAATPDAVVALNESGKGRPGGDIERLGRKC